MKRAFGWLTAAFVTLAIADFVSAWQVPGSRFPFASLGVAHLLLAVYDVRARAQSQLIASLKASQRKPAIVRSLVEAGWTPPRVRRPDDGRGTLLLLAVVVLVAIVAGGVATGLQAALTGYSEGVQQRACETSPTVECPDRPTP